MKEVVKKIARGFDIEIRRFSPESSEVARLNALFRYYGINLVFDVGANTGQYGRELRARGYRGHIVSFEPLPAAHRELCAASRSDANWVVPPPVALGDGEGRVEINVAGNSVSSSLLGMLPAHQKVAPESIYVGRESVCLSRFDRLAVEHLFPDARAFLKIDTQGFELPVLKGAEAVLPRMTGIQIELSLVPLYQGQQLMSEMVRELERRGYALHALIPGLTDPSSGRLLQADGIFFRNDATPAPARD